jgi:hypothetical protein
MKTTLTFLMPLIAIIASVASFNLFTDGSYYSSAILTVVAYLSASASIYLITRKVKVAMH